MTKQHLSAITNQLIQWFWTHGSQRDSRYQLSSSGWLYRLYGLGERLLALPDESHDKPAFGLWGPSQVGKSTLLSSYLDLEADDLGHNSPLQWHPDDPVRFEREGLRTDVVALNPYNLKSDASACITRFTLANDAEDARYPVKVRLASRGQILHSMALGYLSDWSHSGQQTLTDDMLGEMFASLRNKPKQTSRNAYEVAYQTASLLDVLTHSRLQENRYSGLSSRAVTRIVENRVVIGDEGNAEELQRKLFWDNVTSLSQLQENLLQMQNRIGSLSGEGPIKINCSYEVAACLLDMASYVRAVGGTDMQGSRIAPDLTQERRLLGIKYKSFGNRLLLSFREGNALFEKVEQFALFQALVWELVVPVNAARLAGRGIEGQSLTRLLTAADILDFPGVSNIGTGGDDRLNDQIVAKNGSHLLFSHFLKRGKTSAMVAATARTSSIDGFCLLFRTMAPIARPGLICEGIRTWWRFHTGEDLSNQSTETPPVNIVLTFFSEFLNDVLRNPQITRFAMAFEKLRSLGNISSTEISRYFAVAFPKYETLTFPPGTAQNEQQALAQLEDAVTRIMGDPETGALFRDADVIRQTFQETGVSALLENVTAQATAIAGRGRLRKQLMRLEAELRQLLDEAAPGDALEQSRRKELLGKWEVGIREQLGEGNQFRKAKSEGLSQGIRALLTLLPEDLEPVPVNLVDAGRDPKVYLLTQFTRWREKDRSDFDPTQAGLTDSAAAAKILSYFCESISLDEASEWLRANFGWVSDRSAARDSRRYLAVYLTDRMLFGQNATARRHRALESTRGSDCYGLLQKLAESEALFTGETPNTCAHYVSVLEPFLARLGTLAEMTGNGRPPQPGDSELTTIQSAFQSTPAHNR